jgi:hypothetical protein
MGPFADRLDEVLKSATAFHPCGVAVSDSAFALKIVGESMRGSGGFSFLLDVLLLSILALNHNRAALFYMVMKRK